MEALKLNWLTVARRPGFEQALFPTSDNVLYPGLNERAQDLEPDGFRLSGSARSARDR